MVTRKNRLTTDAVREVKATFSRFLSILILSALAVAFLAGLRTTAPDMQYTADKYYDETHLMDAYVLSTLGLTEDDLSAIGSLNGVEQVEGGWTVDAVARDAVVVVKNLPNVLNLPAITEGRMPQTADECVTEPMLLAELGLELGDTLKLTLPEDHEEDLSQVSYTIVGLVDSPLYASEDRGTSSLGTGSVNAYVYIPGENFTVDYYTEAYFTVEGLASLDSYSDEYENRLEAFVDSLESFGEVRAQKRYDDLIGDAQAELDDAREELNDAKTEAEEELSDAEQELADARIELDDGWAEYEDGKATFEEELRDARVELANARTDLDEAELELEEGRLEYEDGLGEYENGLREYEEGLADFEEGVADYEEGLQAYEEGAAEYADGLKKYEEGLAEHNDGVEAYEENLSLINSSYREVQDGWKQYEEGLAQYNAAIASGIPAEMLAGQKAQLDAVYAQLNSSESQINLAYAELYKGRDELDEAAAELADAKAELEKAEAELADAKAELDEAAADIESARAELAAGKAELEDAESELAEAVLEIADAEEQIADGWKEYWEGWATLRREEAEGQQELDDALIELQDGEAEYADGLKEYQEGKAEADAEIADAERKLADAQAELDEVEDCQWYILSRYTNVGFAGYGQDSDRISNLSAIFPIIFFLVAALACLTTMTRMVEEQRTQIGSLKALGFSRFAIAKKYIGYAFWASFIGGILGLVLGCTLIPAVIANAFNIMYNIPPLELKPQPGVCAVAVLAAVLCTTGAALWGCLSTLMDTPANLMRPRTPKAGRRVFLEHIRPLWKRLSFTWKVTVRNLFRYQKRFWMTVIGIGGCTALIVVGFGLHDSIFAVLNRQFDEISLYDATVGLDDKATAEELEEVTSYLDGHEFVERYYLCYQTTADCSSGGAAQAGTIFAVDSMAELTEFIDLRHRQSDEAVVIPTDGVIITEKLSELLELEVGDAITLEGDKRVEARVADIVENYVYHYVYMTRELYTELFGESPDDNVMLLAYTDGVGQAESDEVSTTLMTMDAIASYTYIATVRDTFADSMQAVDYAVIIIILAAAALAFVVLYNLTNINITERTRELATLKVLGFHDGETTAYVYRENIFLTVFGIALGMGMGRALHSWLVVTVEVTQVMFGRTAPAYAYVLAAVLTVVFSVLVNIAAHFKLKKVDMVESLKSVE